MLTLGLILLFLIAVGVLNIAYGSYCWLAGRRRQIASPAWRLVLLSELPVLTILALVILLQ